MAQSLSTLNQIAAKRLSGKAMSSAVTTLAGEKIGSTVQTTAETVIGELVPNNPISSSAYWYLIQSASDADPGTVQYVEFDLVPVLTSQYDNDNFEDTDTAAGENPFSDITDESSPADNDADTYHSYAIKLPDNYVTLVNNASADFDTNASTTTSLGSGVFSNGYYASGSRGKLQVVPEYVSNLPVNNPYVPVLISTNGEEISASDPIDWYFDSYAGILFVQDPSNYGNPGSPTNSNDIPSKLRAFLYVGKYQNEVSGDSVDLHFSASQGGGFSFGNEATASFVTGSTSGEGLTIAASSGNTLEFTLSNVVSGSEQVIDLIEGDTTINITSSYAESSSIFKITDVQDTDFHPIIFTQDSLGSTPTNGASSFERLAISNDGNTGANGFYFRPDDAAIWLTNDSSNYLSIDPTQIVGSNNSFNFLASTPTINIGGSATNAINIGGADHGTTTTVIGTFKVNGWDNVTEDVYNSTVTGSFGIDLIHPNTGSFVISNISESSERTPLVIDSNGKVTQADSDFATDIVISGSIGVNIVSASALSAGAGQGEYDLTVNGVVVSDDISSGLTTTDSPTFADLTLTGDLVVQGTTTTLNTANLLVEDKFILLNSGTLGSPADEGGIVVQTADNGTGTALFYDDNAGRWIITNKDQVAGNASNVTTDITKGTNTMAAVVTVQVDNNAPDHNPFFNTTNFNQGQMYVDKSLTSVTDNNIWIYA